MSNHRLFFPVILLAVAACADPAGVPLQRLAPDAPLRAHTPAPTTVTLPGTFQSELGCAGDWDPACANTHLTYDADDDVWQESFSLLAGNWEYKAALNDSWSENYGLYATRDGPNIPLNVASASSVKFYYDHKSHWITDNLNSVIAVAPGNFQSELGCPGDWDPSCLRSWLQDTDGDGIYTFQTTALPAGSYEVKVAINESWSENYGLGGVPNGPNIPFTVSTAGDLVQFSWDAATKLLTITAPPPPSTVVEIDILPGSAPNVINSKRLLVTVLLKGSASFDVTGIDVTTLRFGPGGASTFHDLTQPGTFAGHLGDQNGDGYVDLVMHYRLADAGLIASSTSACVTAASPGGTHYEGCDGVVMKVK